MENTYNPSPQVTAMLPFQCSVLIEVHTVLATLQKHNSFRALSMYKIFWLLRPPGKRKQGLSALAQQLKFNSSAWYELKDKKNQWDWGLDDLSFIHSTAV